MVDWLVGSRLKAGAALVLAVILLIVIWRVGSQNSDDQTLGDPAGQSSALDANLGGFPDPVDTEGSETGSEKGNLPPPAPLPLPGENYSPRTASEQDITKFLEFAHTFSWETTSLEYGEGAVAAGAVVGSPATQPYWSEREQKECVASKCLSEFIGASSIEVDSSTTASAVVRVQLSALNGKYETLLYCTLDLATGAEPSPGLFTDMECYRGTD